MDGVTGLDVHTLGIIGLAVGIAIALSFSLMSLVLRGMPALHVWAAAFWLLTFAGLAEGYEENGSFLSAIIGSALIALANAAMLVGIAIHLRRPLRWLWPVLVIALFLMIQVAFLAWPPSQPLESAVFGLKSVLWDGWMIFFLLRAPRELRAGSVFTALVFMIDILFYVARGFISLHPEIESPELSSLLTTSNYLFGILCTFLLSTGFTLMLSQRLVYDLRVAADVDGLTGLLNRTALLKGAAPMLQANRELTHAVLLFDLDHFKTINDRWGHAAGDAVLKHFAQTLRLSGLPPRALLSRYGGEEFLLFLPCTSVSVAVGVAESLRALIESSPATYGGEPILFTTSVGVATGTGAHIQRLIDTADTALYQAKRTGRDRVEAMVSDPAASHAGPAPITAGATG
ncbi:GGDEF domain-containing protein [Luteibacter aegosomaticola]|uniref:GGDEF domain-containing protein n=1 Tax=Luteibacter aegosomaticola TaxID=2911538 RepID=UPI001FFB8661|nr:GGDEF domain-containing protein [Luteibacter aegosomaticola]UPG88564.1 GGDEF domain-containing protein [Luteibacter aegosomaticola]